MVFASVFASPSTLSKSNSATASCPACPLSTASVYYSPSSFSSFMIIVVLDISLCVYTISIEIREIQNVSDQIWDWTVDKS